MSTQPPITLPYQSPIVPINTPKVLAPEGPKNVPITLQWNQYVDGSENIGCVINLQGLSATIFSRIRSLIIDNTNCPYYMKAFFSDTNQVVTCAPFSRMVVGVTTSVLTFAVYLTFLSGSDNVLSDNMITKIGVLNYEESPIVAHDDLLKIGNPVPFSNNITYTVTQTHTIPIAYADPNLITDISFFM